MIIVPSNYTKHRLSVVKVGLFHSIANSSLFPTSLYLHSNSTQILALKKIFFFLPFFYATFQCGRYGVFKKIKKNNFDPEKVKKRASKVAHNWPRPLYFTVQPRPTAHSPELIFHIMNSRDQTSVLLSVGCFMRHFLFDPVLKKKKIAVLYLFNLE
jgi:hypothetical protein